MSNYQRVQKFGDISTNKGLKTARNDSFVENFSFLSARSKGRLRSDKKLISEHVINQVC